MPSNPDPCRARDLELAMASLVLEHGLPGLTIRAIAARIGIAPSTLVRQMTGRERLLQWFAAVVAQRRADLMGSGVAHDGLDGLLPHNQSVLDGEALWLAVRELGRTAPVPSEVVEWHEREQRAIVRHALLELALARGDLDEHGRPVRPEPRDVETVGALVDGLRAAMARRLSPLPRADAVRALRRCVEALVGPVPARTTCRPARATVRSRDRPPDVQASTS